LPDAATHLLIQIIVNQIQKLHAIFPYTLFGAIAPDIFKGFSRWAHPTEKWLFYPTHSPIFMLVFFYSFSLLFHEKQRYFVVLGGIIGMVIHLGLDLGQVNLGGGYYMPFFPFSFKRITFGLYATEASIFWLPLTILVTILVMVSRKMLDRGRGILSKALGNRLD